MIRVAFLVDSPSKRAHANAAGRLALGLVETGQVEATIVCYSADPPPPWLPPEVRIHPLGVERVSRSVPSLARYLRAGETGRVDHTPGSYANFVGLAAAWLARVPPRWPGKIVLVQDQFVGLALNWRDNKWIAKASYRFADGLIAPSPTVRDNAVQSCGLDPLSAALVPNAIPKFSGSAASLLIPGCEDGEPPVFVNIGNLLTIKRVDLLIDAFADLRQRHNARLLIVGEGPERSRAAEQIRQLGLSADAEATGWVEDVLPYAAHACALVHSSDEDGFAQVLTEAIARLPGHHNGLAGGRASLCDERTAECVLLVPRGDGRNSLRPWKPCCSQR